MLSSKLKAILGQVLFAVNIFVLFLVVAENRVLIPDWLHVFGRMHPLLLHFPIVIILLALLLVAIPDLLKNKEDSHLYGTDLLLLGTLYGRLYRLNAGLLLSHESGSAQSPWSGTNGTAWECSGPFGTLLFFRQPEAPAHREAAFGFFLP